MKKEYLHNLLDRYEKGECTEHENQLVAYWYSLIDGDAPSDSQQERKQLEDEIWMNIQKSQDNVPEPNKLTRYYTWRWAAAAAIVIGTVWWGFKTQYFTGLSGKAPLSENKVFDKSLKEVNNTDEVKTVTLKDGTVIDLSPKSSIEIHPSFGISKREISLVGKAFFNVKRDSQRPFLVYTGEIATQVLGTSFWVNTTKDKNDVEVSVVTGKVTVFKQNNPATEKVKSGVILTPNQKVTYLGESHSFVTNLVEKPVLINKDQQSPSSEISFVFDDMPLNEIIKRLESAYGIEIVLENERLENCLFTADISSQPLFTKLDLLCLSLNAKYEIIGTKILISGKGCQPDQP